MGFDYGEEKISLDIATDMQSKEKVFVEYDLINYKYIEKYFPDIIMFAKALEREKVKDFRTRFQDFYNQLEDLYLNKEETMIKLEDVLKSLNRLMEVLE